MFVRWQSRNRKLRAVLVKSERIRGAPRQHHIACLGSVADAESAADRCDFWKRAVERIDQLGSRLTAADRQRVEAAIARKVPRPRAADDGIEAARHTPVSPTWPACSFCGKTAAQVAKMVVSATANICSDCLELAVSAIGERKAG